MSGKLSLPRAGKIRNLVPAGKIARSTRYTPEFLRQLARSGRIRAFKFNRDWLTTPKAVDYANEQEEHHRKQLNRFSHSRKEPA